MKRMTANPCDSRENLKNHKSEKWYKNNGITIIVLVVTIIIMLILVGVTISALSGKNGLIKQSKMMSETESKKQQNSQLQISELEAKLATSGDNITISSSELKALISQIVDLKLEPINNNINNIDEKINTTNNSIDSKVTEINENINSEVDEINRNINSKIEGVNGNINNKILSVYPVGSIYISTSNINPATIIGGTWSQITDTFLLAAGSKYSAGSTGGEETHTLTVSEMPSHKHVGLDIDGVFVFGWDKGSVKGFDFMSTNYNYSTANRIGTGYAGGSQPHNNMPPYLAVYVWKRVQ